jgi:3-hydroxybutyryl-CoA dehydratase
MQHDTKGTTLPFRDTESSGSSMVPSPLRVGYQFSGVHVFDAAQVSAFAHAAGDTNPIHHDVQAAAKTRFGKPIVSGTHTTALLMGLVASHLSRLGHVIGVKFTTELLRPVFSDEQVVLTWEVTGIHAHPRHGHFVDLEGSVKGSQGDCRVRGFGQVLVWQ